MGEYLKFLSRYYEQGCNNTNTVLGYWSVLVLRGIPIPNPIRISICYSEFSH